MHLGGPLGPKLAKASIFDRCLIDFWSTLGSLWEQFLVKKKTRQNKGSLFDTICYRFMVAFLSPLTEQK